MGLLDFFKKKETPSYDSSDIRITDLGLGFVFEYDLTSWVVEEEYEYDWGDECFSKEYKISNGTETRFLAVEDDDELYISISNKIRVRDIDEDLPDQISENEAPPKKITYKDRKYFLEEENPGYYRNVSEGEENWTELIAWEYEDDDNNILTIEQWGENNFEASEGKYLKEIDISNILPK